LVRREHRGAEIDAHQPQAQAAKRRRLRNIDGILHSWWAKASVALWELTPTPTGAGCGHLYLSPFRRGALCR
jgi:hypothetical protein